MIRKKEQKINESEVLNPTLTEAEETLKAILSGEVDAIVVSGKQGESIYSVTSAETPYRTFVETMNEGAVTLSKEGVILYCNRRFAEFVNEPSERVIGSYIKRFISSEDKHKLKFMLAQQTYNKNDTLIISLINGLYLKLSFHVLQPSPGVENCILIATDISELKKKESELLETQNLLKQQYECLKGLRIELINKRIDNETAINHLMVSKLKLENEIAKLKSEVLQKNRV